MEALSMCRLPPRLRRVALHLSALLALLCSLLGLLQLCARKPGDLPCVGSSSMPAKASSSSKASATVDDVYDVKLKMLAALQEDDDAWWEGIEVNVP